jgi:hypothetical protein
MGKMFSAMKDFFEGTHRNTSAEASLLQEQDTGDELSKMGQKIKNAIEGTHRNTSSSLA